MEKVGLNSIPFEGFADEGGRRHVFICNMDTGISRWSKKAVEYFALPGEYMKDAGKIWAEHIHPEDRAKYLKDIEMIFSGEKNSHILDYRARNGAGEYVVCTCKGRVMMAEDGLRLFVGTIENHGISDYIDSVSGLYNVYAFLRDARGFRQSEKENYLLAIAINHYADVNKMYGYENGNRIIKMFVEKMRSFLEMDDIIYRMDGVKFCVFKESGTIGELREIYSKLTQIAHEGFDLDGMHTSFTLSGGVVRLEDKNISEYSIQASLGYVLDQSKYHNYGELVVFSDGVAEETKKNLAAMEALRTCVFADMDGYYLCYQPIIEVSTDAICGMEALIRWNKEPYGEIPPGVFIPWLENDPCFYILGSWVMKQALMDAKKLLPYYPDFIVNVNVSVEQIERSGFRKLVCDLLEEVDFPPENLCMELTERVMSMDLKFLQEELKFFRSMGIKIALDDFGTGVSSLNLLLELSVDYLKIDRKFVKDISSNKAEQLMVETIAFCADGMNLDICVEGVETEEMKEFLMQYKIQKHQGYYYSKPITFEKFQQLVL